MTTSPRRRRADGRWSSATKPVVALDLIEKAGELAAAVVPSDANLPREGHAEPFGDPGRRRVVSLWHRADPIEPECREGLVERGCRAFGGVALAPGRRRESPPDLDS